MKKISLENIVYHLIPSGIAFLIYFLLYSFFKELPILVVSILVILQIGIMQFVMNANTMAKKPYMTVTNITGYVKSKRLGAFVINAILVAGLIIIFYIVIYKQFGDYLLMGSLKQLPPLLRFEAVQQGGIWLSTINPALMAIVFGFLQPLYEGIYFRGFLLYDMRKLKWLGVGLSALLFAITHLMTLQYFVYYLLLGGLLSSITYMTKNLYIGIFAQWLAYASIGGLLFFKVIP
jgi:membrane protease YdiL (CAAX protease family)